MAHFRKKLVGAVCLTAATVGFAPAQAAVIITSPASLNLLDLGTGNGAGLQANRPSSGLAVGISAISYSGPGTGLYSGNAVNSYVSPFGAGSNKDFFAVQANGTITFTFATAQTSFALLFGTIDNYNSITFGTSGGQTFTGTDVVNAIGGATTNKNVLFSGLNSFTTLTASDSQVSAFEFVPGTVAAAVPEPTSLALLSAGLIGVSVWRRKHSK